MKTVLSVICVLFLTVSAWCGEGQAMRINSISRQSAEITITQHGTCSPLDGTEFGIDGAIVITAKHVVTSESKRNLTFKVEIEENQWVEADLIAVSDDSDLAILRVKSPVPWKNFKLAPSEQVLAIGSTLGEPTTAHRGGISQYVIDVPMEHGMSGGPVFDETAHIAGVMIAITKDDKGKAQGLVLSAGTVRKFLKSIHQVAAK